MIVLSIIIVTLLSVSNIKGDNKKYDMLKISSNFREINRNHNIIRKHINDSIARKDTIKGDSINKKAPFSDVIKHFGEDSTVFSVHNQKMFLYKNAYIKYIKTELYADYIRVDMKNNVAYASGLRDTTGKLIGKPKFKDGSQEFTCEELEYNFKTGKGYVKNIITKEGEGFIQGKITKKESDSVYFVKKGLYTTCDLHDHPHFYIRMSKAKMIRNRKIFFGFANLVIADVPLPIFIPFGFFPLSKTYSSGFIMPTYGEERMRGFNLRGGGYYWAINDYVDLGITGDIYTNGSWATNAFSSYRKRYRYSGSINFTMSSSHVGDKGLPDYSESSDWSIRWTHSQDPKANPYSTFSASVDMSSSKNNYYNATNINDIANQRKTSSISWSKRWPDSPFSINASFNHNQNSRDSTISITLPTLNINMNQIYPFRRKNQVGEPKWYENIGISYSASIINQVNNLKEDQLFKSSSLKKWRNGFRHSTGLSTSINLAKDLSFSPSIRYEGVASLSNIRKHWEKDDALPTKGQVVTDTLYGLFYAHNYSSSASISYNPTIYGMYIFKPESKINAIRHVVRPSISASYVPKFGKNNMRTYSTDLEGQSQSDHEYNPFANSAYQAPSGMSRESGSVQFSLDNNIEMKVRNDDDTTGKNEFKKIKLLESFRLSSSFNPFEKEFKWSQIQLSARTRVFKDKVNINLSGTLDPYAIDENGQRLNRYAGGLGRLTRVSASTGIQFSADDGKSREKKNAAVGGYYDRYMDFDVPWSINVDYTFNYSKNQFKSDINQMLRISGDISLTPKWKIGYSSGYDFKRNEVTSTSFNISRDLHCWEMTFSVIPFGTHQSYNFQINVRSSLLKDLKLTKRETWFDR